MYYVFLDVCVLLIIINKQKGINLLQEVESVCLLDIHIVRIGGSYTISKLEKYLPHIMSNFMRIDFHAEASTSMSIDLESTFSEEYFSGSRAP